MMIDVLWWNACFGNWDMGLLAGIFDKHPETFIQHNTQEPPFFERAIVIVAGKPEVAPLRSYLDTLKSGLVILTSEEDGYFNWKAAIPPHLEIWTQYWTSSKREIKERLLLGAPIRIKDYDTSPLPKKYLWSFIGQIQNQHRQACVDVLRTLPDGYLQIVEFFGGEGKNGMDYQAYLDIMRQSKFVICPSGSMSSDSFRMYEAMECGANVIVDTRCPRDPIGFDYWNLVYPDNTIPKNSTTWSKAIMDFMMEWNIQDFNLWWPEYKQQLETKLLNYGVQ